MLKIRGFVEGEGEEAWIGIHNEAYREYDDFKVAHKDLTYLRKID